MLLDSCKKLGCLGLSWFKIYFYLIALYCNYLHCTQHCRSISSIKKLHYIGLGCFIRSSRTIFTHSWALFPFVYDISFVLDRKHALQAESYSVVLLANARRSPSSLPLSTHAQTSFQPRLSRVREGSASQLANSY